MVPSLQGEIFIDQITGNICTCDYANKLFMSLGEIDHDMAEDLQRFLRDQNEKWEKITVLCWLSRIPTKSALLYIVRVTGQ